MLNKKHVLKPLLFVTLIIFSACDYLFEYSPYKAGVKVSDHDLNIKVVDRLQKYGSTHFSPFTIGVFGDTHTFYDEFEQQVRLFNRKDSLDFVVHMGDLTLSGIYREFMWYREISSKLKHPLLTIIGNHDYLSNGEFLYSEMFGPCNFTLVYKNCLFVFLDDIIWEKNVADPDFEWLENVLKGSEDYTYRFVFSHIPPWSSPFSHGNEYYFNQLMHQYNVDLSLHGHTHNFSYDQRYETGPPYFTSSSSDKEEVFYLDVEEDGFEIRIERF
jgi:3',5'-cyclic-AMP phosphodiesterase